MYLDSPEGDVAQLAELRDAVAARGWTTTAEYIDFQTSHHRPGLNELVRIADRFDFILCFWPAPAALQGRRVFCLERPA
jgi:hypothetical protein